MVLASVGHSWKLPRRHVFQWHSRQEKCKTCFGGTRMILHALWKNCCSKKAPGYGKRPYFSPFLMEPFPKRSDGLWRLACGDVFSWGLLTWQNCTFWFKLQNIGKHTKNGREKVYGMYWAFEMVSDFRFGHCKCHFPNRQNCEIARFSRFWLWSSLWCFLNHLAAAAPVYLLA